MPTNIVNRQHYDFMIASSYYAAKPPSPFKSYLILTNGLTITDTTTLAAIIAAELPEINGYGRMNYKVGSPNDIIEINTSNSFLKTAQTHQFSVGDLVYFIGYDKAADALANLPISTPQINSATPYYIVDSEPVTQQFKVSQTALGTPIEFSTGFSAGFFVARAGIYNASTLQYDSPTDNLFLTAGSSSNLTYDHSIMILNAKGWANRQISSINASTNTFTTAINHGLETGDSVFLTADAGGNLPLASGASFGSNNIFRVLSPYEKDFQLTLDGSNPIDITSAGNGTIRVRNATGRWATATKEDAAVTIAANKTRQFAQTISLKTF